MLDAILEYQEMFEDGVRMQASGEVSGYMVSRWSRVKAGCAFALACVLPCAWTPGAFAADDGRWPVANDVVAAAWKQGIDGSGVKVAVLDSQAVEDYPALKHASITYKLGRFHNVDDKTVECKVDGKPLTATIKSGEGGYYSSHGTDMLAWIVGDGSNYTSKWPGIMGSVPKADVLHITDGAVNAGPAVTPCDQKLAGDATSDSGADVKTAVDWGARILNRSQGGALVNTDYAGYVDALRHGVVMVEGRANDMNPGLDDLTGDPRSMETFPGVVMVNSVDESGNLAPTSDVMDGNVAVLSYGMNVLDPVNPLSNVYDITGNGGTSTAAAVLSSYLALAMQKWPDATGNQIIQSLIRNTKSGKGKPVIDPERKRGFGEVDLNALLTVDPAQYKDVNPILEYQMKAASQYPDLKDWYTQDCKTNPDGVGTAADNVPCEAGLIGREYERQQAAWKKVEQCRSDGGSDCIQYSATNTANGATTSTKTLGRKGTFLVSTWLAYMVAGGVTALIAGVVIALIFVHRRRRAD
ncbi:S8/S53 family peptidase [Bifidobacterium longum]|uniref:S8/S53 family peptidase n=1 Tax=Bifidobacterium longum TaxID=216816 RepID=UPI003CFEBBB6